MSKPWNWTGENVIASNGYVLTFVGKDHHLADVRGYAYEHRVVAEKQIGRQLISGEIVHHKDGVKTNNNPENLEVVSSHAEHFLLHRKEGSFLQLPDEPNPIIPCLCGCGNMMDKYDDSGRPRVYLSGHNPHPASTQDAIMYQLIEKPMSRTELANNTGIQVRPIATALNKLKHKGFVHQISRGVWKIC